MVDPSFVRDKRGVRGIYKWSIMQEFNYESKMDGTEALFHLNSKYCIEIPGWTLRTNDSPDRIKEDLILLSHEITRLKRN